jgi:AcrR family transcriptional regulator
VFWQLGYEGTTLADLQNAMGGLNAPSLYAAFGSKEALFREAIELHIRTYGERPSHALDTTPEARAAIEAMLYAVADAYSQPGKPHGCLLVLGAINCTRENQGIQEHLRDLRQQREKAIRRRLERGVAEGDLSPRADTSALASYCSTVIDGLALQARDGASRKSLRTTARLAMAALDREADRETRPEPA